jgi:hypothetical protein
LLRLIGTLTASCCEILFFVHKSSILFQNIFAYGKLKKYLECNVKNKSAATSRVSIFHDLSERLRQKIKKFYFVIKLCQMLLKTF